MFIFVFGLNACSTSIHSTELPPEQIIKKIPLATEPNRWSYRLIPIDLDAGSSDESFVIWHSKISRDNFSTKAKCLEAASKGLESLGKEAWNFKVTCASSPQNLSPIAVIDRKTFDLVKAQP